MRKNKKQRRVMFLLILILSITIGFALLSTTLFINGTANIKSNTWNIHWDSDSIEETTGSVTATTPASVTDAEEKNISFAVEFELPGDFYEFSADAVNEGSIDGKIENISIKFYEADGTTEIDKDDLPEEITYSLTHKDGTAIAENEVIAHGGTISYKFRIGYNSETTTLPTEPIVVKPDIEITPVQHKEETSSPWILPTGKTKDTLEVGDEICLREDTTQCFNFIKYDSEDIVMLAKYNLNVGNNAKGNETFMQDSEAVGRKSTDQQIAYGNVNFSYTPYWMMNNPSFPVDVYDPTYKTAPDFSNQGYNTQGYSVAYYVEEYKSILEEHGVNIKNARLLTYEEVTSNAIGCTYENGTGSCPSNSYVLNTSFWLGTAYSSTQVWFVNSAGFINTNSFNSDYYFGVRPVVVISKSTL